MGGCYPTALAERDHRGARPLTPLLESWKEPRLTLAAGTRLGAYEILAPLGSGGMGEVYRALDTKLDREVAVKVLPATVADDPDALARFEREAKAVAALSHPNILAIHDFGSQDGVEYAVTELLNGETLRDKLVSGPLTLKQATDYGLQITRGLSAAHERGIVHRDLKPENVFVTKDGHLKILDFGLAKRIEPAASKDTSASTGSGHTQPGTVMGTMGYMSPEQLKALPVDHRSDIFSFGAVLFELISGRKAFQRDTPSETIAAILREDPPELTGSGRNIPVALDHIVHHCLEKEPLDRFQSARDVTFALSEASGPATARIGVQAESAAGRRRWLPPAAALLIVAAAAGVFLARRPHRTAPSSRGVKRIAVLPFENLGSAEDDYFSDGIADEIRGKLTSLSGIQVIARGSSTPYRKTTKTPKEIAGELGVEYLLTATVRSGKDAGASRVQVRPELVDVSQPDTPTSKWQQTFDANVTDVFRVQSDIASQVAQALGTVLGAGEEKRLSEKPTQNLASYDAFLKGEEASHSLFEFNPARLRKALGFYEQAVTLDPTFARAWASISVANSTLYPNSIGTAALSERAREAAEKAVALAPGRPEGYLALGYYESNVRRDSVKALAQFARGQRVAPADADLLTAVARAEGALGQWDASVEHLKGARRLDPRSVNVHTRLGRALLWLRRYVEAREALDRGLALAPSNVTLLSYKSMTFLGQGDLSGARALLAAPREIDRPSMVAFMATFWDLVWVLEAPERELVLRMNADAFDGDIATLRFCQAQVYALKGDRAGLRPAAIEAARATEAQVQEAPDSPEFRAQLGRALAYAGQPEKAIEEARRAVALVPISRDANIGPYYQHQLAWTYVLVGQHEKAIDALEPLLKIPYFLSPAWLRIDPNFDPLRKNQRFETLVDGVSPEF